MVSAPDKPPEATPPEAITSSMYSAGMLVTITGIAVNIILIIIKLASGMIGNSAAMIADAVHSVSDFITDIGVFVGLRFLAKPADRNHPYGHGRLETTISLFMGLIIILTGLGIAKNALWSIIAAARGTFPEMPGMIALAAGIVSIVSKEVMFHYTRAVAKKSGSRTLEANAWHHRSDAMSSVGTVLGIGGAILFGNHWTVLDPIAAAFVSILVVKVGIEIGWNAFREISDEALPLERQRQITEAILRIAEIREFHKLRTRSLGRYVTVDAHICVNPNMSVREAHNIATRAETAVREALGNAAFVTIHIEPDESSSPL